MYYWKKLCLIQFFILLVIYTFFGLMPSPDTYIPTVNDKITHFSGYFIAAFSISFAYPKKAYWQKICFLILFSVMIEIGQHFMPPRTFDRWDIFANSCGVLGGITFLMGLEKYSILFNKFLHLGRNESQ